MLPGSRTARTRSVLVVVVLTIAIAIGAVLVLLSLHPNSSEGLATLTSSTPNPSSSSSLASSANTYPVEVVTVTGPVPPYVHGEPVVSILLKNVGGAPIASLNATLAWVPPSGVAGAGAAYPFIFNVSSSDPLLSGQSTSLRLTLFGPDFESDQNYPLTISGTLRDDTPFSFTESVIFVRESL